MMESNGESHTKTKIHVVTRFLAANVDKPVNIYDKRSYIMTCLSEDGVYKWVQKFTESVDAPHSGQAHFIVICDIIVEAASD